MGAVATTFMAGVESIRRGLTLPVGSLTQMQCIRIGKRSANQNPMIKELVNLAPLDDIVFAGWDVFADDAFEAASRAAVLKPSDLAPLSDFLHSIKPMTACFDQHYVKRLDGPNVKKEKNKLELAQLLRQDIRDAIKRTGADRAVMVWCGSTEVYIEPAECHKSLKAFERGLAANDINISPAQIYAYAALMEGVPYANGAPHMSADSRAIEELAHEKKLPIAGKDFKTGQTMMKTVLAPAFKARMLGIAGWYSTNILGNRDGEVLDDPESFRSKEISKSSVLDLLQKEVYPALYGNLYHKVRINYYPPRGDEKEGWDNIDIFGWMGYPMQIKVDFLCRDSILAAPIVLDLALLLDLSHRAGRHDVQEWLSFYFKAPHVNHGNTVENDLFIQHFRLKNTLRVLAGQEPLTHLEESNEE
jgi:myo-inositol-1-phosphate synthase